MHLFKKLAQNEVLTSHPACVCNATFKHLTQPLKQRSSDSGRYVQCPSLTLLRGGGAYVSRITGNAIGGKTEH